MSSLRIIQVWHYSLGLTTSRGLPDRFKNVQTINIIVVEQLCLKRLIKELEIKLFRI